MKSPDKGSIMKRKILTAISLAAVLAVSPVGVAYAAEETDKTEVTSEENETEEEGIQKEPYYDAMRENMPEGSYGDGGYLADDYWSCAGYAAHVLYLSARAGAFGGYVPDFEGVATASASGLDAFMRTDENFELVRFFNENDSYAAWDDLNEKTADGTIKAGDIIVYISWGGTEEGGGREHVAIIDDKLYDGHAHTYTGYGETFWSSSFLGEATVINSLNYSYGTAFEIPANEFFYDGQATGYVVYRVAYDGEEEEEIEVETPVQDNKAVCDVKNKAAAEIPVRTEEKSALKKVTDDLLSRK